MDRYSTEPIDMLKVLSSVEYFKHGINVDRPEDTHEKIKEHWCTLNNNERIAVQDRLMDKAPDSNKKYKNLLKEHLDYRDQG